jgi:hypothetical protein
LLGLRKSEITLQLHHGAIAKLGVSWGRIFLWQHSNRITTMITLTIIPTITGSTPMIMESITTTTVVGAGCSQSSLGTAMITQTQLTTR